MSTTDDRTSSRGGDISTGRPDARRIDRYEAPNYLARYRDRQTRNAAAAPPESRFAADIPAGSAQGPADAAPADAPPAYAASTDAPVDDASTPLYLRRFRQRGAAVPAQPRVEFDGAQFTPALAAASRGKEVAAPISRRASEKIVCEISILRHGITQGYSTDAGLTPMGGWQAHRRGHELARRWNPGDEVRLVCADTNRARQTAHQVYRGATDGMAMWGVDAQITEPEPIPELRNFGVWTPDGLRDVTSAFRQYQSTMEKLERMAVGERPRWLVEIDRFYRTQLGGSDPIQEWLTIPMMYFEPPALCVRRFWRGFHRLVSEIGDDELATGRHRIVAATHSGPMRAFATWAHGYDPGEPLNTEEIRVKLREDRRTAFVSYRNRVTEVLVPPPDEFPQWES